MQVGEQSKHSNATAFCRSNGRWSESIIKAQVLNAAAFLAFMCLLYMHALIMQQNSVGTMVYGMLGRVITGNF